MDREEILAKSRSSKNINGDEMELSIDGKANVVCKGVFTVLIILLVLFRWYRNLDADELMAIYFSYGATEGFYKYSVLKNKKTFIIAIWFTILAITALLSFIIKTI